jgi:hypothetical protein
MSDVRTALMNIPCTGKFNIFVRPDDGWTITLSHNDGSYYMRFSGTTFTGGVFVDPYNVFSTFTIPDWMLESLMDKVNELILAGKRDSIHTPNTVGTA